MTRTITFMPFILDLFDGAAAGGEGGAAAAPAASGARSVPEGAPALKSRKAGAFDNVVFGKQPEGQGIVSEPAEKAPDAGGQAPKESKTTTAEAEERKARYRAFKEGEFKDLFGEDVNRIMGRKTRENSALQAQLDAQKPAIEMLQQRYGTDDMKVIAAKLENDDNYWQEAADEVGMTVEQVKLQKKLERDNRALLQVIAAQRRQTEGDQRISKWLAEGEQLKARFPSFDFKAEDEDPKFAKTVRYMTDVGFTNPVEATFYSIHGSELLSNAMSSAAAATEQKITANVRAKGARPAEAANTPKGAVIYKNDVTKLTKADRAEIARRSYAGEKISF